MKRLVGIALALVLCFVLAGCDSPTLPDGFGKTEITLGINGGSPIVYGYAGGYLLTVVMTATVKAGTSANVDIAFSVTNNEGDFVCKKSCKLTAGETYILRYTFAYTGDVGDAAPTYDRRFTIAVGGVSETINSREKGIIRGAADFELFTLAEYERYLADKEAQREKAPYEGVWADADGKYRIVITKNSNQNVGNLFNDSDFFWMSYPDENELRIYVAPDYDMWALDTSGLAAGADSWATRLLKNRTAGEWQSVTGITLYRLPE